MNSAQEIIQHLALQPHPEGGYFKETYRNPHQIPASELGADYSGARNYATSIYFLLTQGNFSAFHKIVQDEQWHFYDGATLWLHMISPEGEYKRIEIGRNIAAGEVPQFTVPGGYWFGAEVKEGGEFSFVGCTVAPGFDFDDFEMPSQEDLLAMYPQHENIIRKLTRA
ncbi:cupin domain-containing protein [Aureisphaera galaxeae]|uniref:cupin domain-containing protein n=1 Tax=Aureisphaera galaxeae TaxID=1538023 RepID=UPI002350A91B|nr:cupin domain-containing protein [Aureisphaera galaxeae]MDC8003834.1 cupin domain-containing protein [Aureisphaera galaxeae]